jgi:DNA repair exonuclease SbcCD ATPase subunit
MHIVLKEMALENFMMYAAKTFTFFDVTKIMAENGRGKSSIVNAYTWLMFNCDYELKDNPQIRRMVDGKTVDDTDVVVEAVFDIDGKKVKAKKVQKRKYGKDGISYKDDNSYYINDAPKTMTAFNEYFDIDMSVLRICSNINAFISQKPAEMREFLFSMADDVKDLEIAIQSPSLIELVPLLEKYSAEEIEAMNKATRAKIVKELPILDGQIIEKERDVQIRSTIDVSELELLRNSLKEQLEKNIKEQAESDGPSAYEKLADEIMKLQTMKQSLQHKADEELNLKKQATQERLEILTVDLHEATKKVNTLLLSVQSAETILESKIEERKKQAELWKEASQREFDENSLICAYCGQEYPQEKQAVMKADFEKHKAEEIKAITEKGMVLKAEIDRKTSELSALKEKHEQAKKELFEARNLYEGAEKTYKSLPLSVDISDLDEVKEINSKLVKTTMLIQSYTSNSEVKKQLKTEENEIRQKLLDCETEIAKSDTTADEIRLEKLKTDREDLVQSQADAEKILYLLGELSKVKNNALSDAINGKFTSVKWKLWELNKSGGYKNVCVPMYDGKSILDIASNKGNRILGKIDICNSIQKYKKINVPIFLDDVENLDSNNQQKIANMVDCQLIMLAVNDNKDLEVLEGVRRK